MSQEKTGAQDVRWNLEGIFGYTGINDSRIDVDVALWCDMAKEFHEAFRGNLKLKLAPSILAREALEELLKKIGVYTALLAYLDTGDPVVQTRKAKIENDVRFAMGKYLTFYDIEVAGLDETVIDRIGKDPSMEKYLPWLMHKRELGKHNLSESVESALKVRESFGPESLKGMFKESSSDLRFPFGGEEKTLTQVLHIASYNPDAQVRALALKTVNTGLQSPFAKLSRKTLTDIAGLHAIEVRERGYKNPLEIRNKASRLPNTTVDALYAASLDRAVPLAKRYYRLKADILGLETLRWSDRNAPMPFSDTTIIPWDKAIAMVLAAYGSFSPTLVRLIEDMVEKRWIDAPAVKGKVSGAFNYPGVLPGGKPFAWTFLNYLGTPPCVMTLAHELGHGVHFMLAGKKMGVLQQLAPMALCETASIFGEMTTFNFLKDELIARGDKKALFSLLMAKIDEIINIVVRQIGFHEFEMRVHGWDPATATWGNVTAFSVDQLCTHWLETLEKFYGKSGEVFTYEHVSHLWSVIPHFHEPFYVYAYAFGELLTQSLYAKRAAFGERFEPLYLDLLRAGSSKDVVELLAPFGLDPTDPEFWNDGIEISLGAMVREAEALARELKLIG
jgi:oligoendopeptidase F